MSHPIQTAELCEYPSLLKHSFQEGDVVVLNPGKGHKTRVAKDLIRKDRAIWRRINAEKGLFIKHRFHEGTRAEIRRKYYLITSSEGVVIGRSPLFGQPIGDIANVCYLVGGSGYGGISYDYDVCFTAVEIDRERERENLVCMIWTLWGGALKLIESSPPRSGKHSGS